jgi:hypothetical protein
VDKDQFLDGINQAEQWTEDLFFFNKLEEIGGRVFCDASVICEHVDIYNNKIYRLPKNSLPMRQKLVTHEKKVLILGPDISLNEPCDITRVNDDDQADYRCTFDNLPFDKEQFDWVIVTEPQTHWTLAWNECKRVSKDRVSINLDESLNRDFWIKHHGGTLDGSFIEWRKNVNTENPVQSNESSNNNNISVAG